MSKENKNPPKFSASTMLNETALKFFNTYSSVTPYILDNSINLQYTSASILK